MTKKKYITGITIVILTTSVLAEDRTGFYLKGNVGASKMKNAKQHNIYPEYHINLPDNKSKSKVSPTFNIAAGFYLNDYVRYDLNFGYQKVNFKKSVVDCIWYDLQNENILDQHGKFTVNRKASIYSLMFNGYVDLPISDKFNLFAGAGLGIAKINEKGNLIITANKITKSSDKVKSKNKQNFAYSLTTGISLKVSDKTNFELSYSYQDFGKTKYKDKDVTKNHYNSHSIMTGIRFDI